jgi:hypothetical protein
LSIISNIQGLSKRAYNYIKPYINIFKLNSQPIVSEGLREKYLTKTLDYSAGIEYELENPDTLLEDKSQDLTLYDTIFRDDKIKSFS